MATQRGPSLPGDPISMPLTSTYLSAGYPPWWNQQEDAQISLLVLQIICSLACPALPCRDGSIPTPHLWSVAHLISHFPSKPLCNQIPETFLSSHFSGVAAHVCKPLFDFKFNSSSDFWYLNPGISAPWIRLGPNTLTVPLGLKPPAVSL